MVALAGSYGQASSFVHRFFDTEPTGFAVLAIAIAGAIGSPATIIIPTRIVTAAIEQPARIALGAKRLGKARLAQSVRLASRAKHGGGGVARISEHASQPGASKRSQGAVTQNSWPLATCRTQEET